MKQLHTGKVVAVFAVALSLGLATFASAATLVGLGSAGNYAVLAGSTITNTGSSVISGDLGLTPGTSVTGFPPGTLNGTLNVANTNAIQAETDLTNAYTLAAGQSTSLTIPTELGGTTVIPGVYDSASGTFGITGSLTLDAQGDPNAVFIFKTSSTLVTAGASTIVLANGAQACNVFWQVGSSATLGANSTFSGNILALTSVTLTTGAKVTGSVLARNGAVTLDTNNVSKSNCTVSAVTPTTTPTVTIPAVAAVATPVVVVTPVVAVAPTNVSFPKTGFPPRNNTSAPGALLVLVLLAGAVFASKKLLRA